MIINDIVLQRDVEFKIRHSLKGGHYHCALFARNIGSATWAKCGDFVVRDDEITALIGAMKNVIFEEKGLA